MYLISNLDVIHSCLNSQTWWTWAEQPKIHARTMKIQPKLEKFNLSSYEMILLLDHNETSPIRFRWVFYEIQSKIVFSQSRWKLSLIGFDGWKKLEVGWNNIFMCYSGVRRLSLITLTSLTLFTHFTHFDGKINLWTHSQSSQFSQNSHKLSL